MILILTLHGVSSYRIALTPNPIRESIALNIAFRNPPRIVIRVNEPLDVEAFGIK